MTKIMILVIMIATIAGCTPFTPKDCQKKNALDSCSYNRSGKVTVKAIYGEQASVIKKTLDAALTKPYAWNGKRCNVHLDFNMDGTLQNFTIKSENKDYCRALAGASNRENFQHLLASMFTTFLDLPSGICTDYHENKSDRPFHAKSRHSQRSAIIV